jgi:hypothetical protein
LKRNSAATYAWKSWKSNSLSTENSSIIFLQKRPHQIIGVCRVSIHFRLVSMYIQHFSAWQFGADPNGGEFFLRRSITNGGRQPGHRHGATRGIDILLLCCGKTSVPTGINMRYRYGFLA